jgi:DNA-binding transcriptional LysR family regulator
VPHLSEFLQQYPQVRIQLDVSDALSSLAAEGYDLAVRHGFQVPETHVAWKLCDTSSVLVATEQYLQRQGEPRDPGDLTSHAALANGTLIQVLKDWTLKGAFADEIYLIRPYSPHVPNSVSALVSFLKEKLSGGFRFG